MTSSTTVPAGAGPAGLAAEYRRLVELNRSRDRFLHTVSHELRTPLTSILSCTGLLTDERTGTLNPDQREFVDIVGRNAGRLLRLVENLLELAGLESGRLPLDRELLDLPDVLAAAASAPPPEVYDDGVMRLDPNARTVLVGGTDVRLSPTEFRLLAVLARNSGQVLTPAQLLDRVWGDPTGIGPERVKFAVLRLRRRRHRVRMDPDWQRLALTYGWSCLAVVTIAQTIGMAWRLVRPTRGFRP